MKQTLLLFVSMLLPIQANAEDLFEVEINNITYNLFSDPQHAVLTSKSEGKYSGNLIIPETVTFLGVTYNVTSIDDLAFYDCKSLSSIQIPNTISYIGSFAFQNCNALSAVRITDIEAWCKITFNGSLSNPLRFAHHLYIGDEEIKDLIIPQSINTLNKYVFNGCSSLTSVTISGNIMSIGDGAFEGCSGLLSFIIPDGVSSIGDFSFSGCSGLTSISIPNSIASIGRYAFEGCKNIVSVTIPNNVNTIEEGTFQNCSGLKNVYCQAESVPTAFSDSFDSNLDKKTLYVPESSLSLYRTAEPWSNFGNIFSFSDEAKCPTPIISFLNGKLSFSCNLEGAEYHYDISSQNKGIGNIVNLPAFKTYIVSVYASKDGYKDSNVATKTITIPLGNMNGDGQTTITDAFMIIDMILKKE